MAYDKNNRRMSMRPKSKVELVGTANKKFAELWEQIAKLSEEEQQAPFLFDETFLEKKKETHWRRDKELKDVLIHLYEWHQLLLKWVQRNRREGKSPFLPAPYNWRTYGQMNVGFVAKHKDTLLSDAKSLVYKTHEQVMSLMDEFDNDELFEKKKFDWTGNTSLGSYFISSTASHYEWAIKKIKQYQKQ